MAPGTKGSKNDLFSGPPFFVFFRVFSTFFTFFQEKFLGLMATFARTGISMPQKIGQPKNRNQKMKQRKRYETIKTKFKNQINEKNVSKINRSNEIQKMIQNNEIRFYMVKARNLNFGYMVKARIDLKNDKKSDRNHRKNDRKPRKFD
jgi:hypothetical protein